jgi:Pyridoxamine 5'-phosphate oxidase
VTSFELDKIQEDTFARATVPTASSFPPESRLHGRRLIDYLDRRAFAVVSSARLDGRPHSTITSYVRRGARFWLPAVAGSVRERNVAARPWLVLVITEGDRDEHVAVIIEGPAVVVAPADVPVDVSASRSGEWISVWIRLDAQRVLSYASEGAA